MVENFALILSKRDSKLKRAPSLVLSHLRVFAGTRLLYSEAPPNPEAVGGFIKFSPMLIIVNSLHV